MNGPYYIVSDNHFMMMHNSSEEERRNRLFQVFDKIKSKGQGTLIIGGDFFDFWFETNNAVPKGYENIIEALENLSKAGIDIHYVAGNHDYWDFGYLTKNTNLNFHRDDLIFDYNDKKILVTHGDGLLKNDYGYRFMKKIIRHKIFIEFFKIFPESLSFKFANKMSKSSSEYNHNDKYIDTIKKDLLTFSKIKWNEGYDIILVGHYHQQEIIKHKNKKLIFLGDWLQKFTVTKIDQNDIWQGNWEDFIKLA